MKRVIIAADGVTVANVTALSAGSPAGTGTFLDVGDMMRVSPFSAWNGSTSSPAFTAAPAQPLGNATVLQRMKTDTDANGQLVVVWPTAFNDVPIPISFQILDPAGGVYAATLLANSATGLTYQVQKKRSLPAVIALLGTIAGYDTYQPAPAGLACYVSAILPA